MEEFRLYVNESNYNDCKPVVRRAVAYTCAEAHNFGDIYHEAWLSLLKHIIKHGSFTFEDCSYLVRVARRICLRWLRKQALFEEFDQQISTEEREDFYGTVLNTFDKIFDIKKDKIIDDENVEGPSIIDMSLLSKSEHELMKRVGERCWKILMLRFYFNYPTEKIAEVMGWENHAVVYNEVYRCVKRAFDIINELKNNSSWN